MKIDNSSLNKQKIDELAEKLFDTITLEYEAYTPSMIGDFNTEHYQKIKNEDDTERYMITGYPTAKPILGKARWLMRVAIATALGLCTHREAEKALPVTIESGRKQLKIPLIPFLLGATPAHKTVKTAWRGVISLVVEPLGKLIRDKYSIVDEAFEEEFNRANTRYNLLALGAKSKNILPLSKEALSFSMRIQVDKHRIDKVNKQDKTIVDAGLDLALLSIAATPLILGLGKGANRGFGRFRPKNPENTEQNNKPPKSLCDRLKTETGKSACEALASLSRGEGEQQEQQETLQEFLDGLVKLVGGKGKGKCLNKHKIPWIPTTDTGMVRVVPYRQAYSCRVKASCVNQAIAAIARASMKGEWKELCNDRNRPGTLYHTWLLGLPRSQKFPGNPKKEELRKSWCRIANGLVINDIKFIEKYNCKKDEDIYRKLDNYAVRQKFKTGYLAVKETHSAIFAKLNYKAWRCSDRPRGNIVVKNWSELGVEEPRRQSLIIAFPLPASAASQKPPVAVVAFPSYDLLDYLTGDNNKGLVLYHAGPHRWQNCSQVLISVRTIASQTGQIAGKPMGVKKVRRGNCSTTNYNITQSNGFDTLLRDVFDSFVEVLG